MRKSLYVTGNLETLQGVPTSTEHDHSKNSVTLNLGDLLVGLITSFQLNIINHGVIRADNLGIQFPSHPSSEFTTST